MSNRYSELKLCPFCGGFASVQEHYADAVETMMNDGSLSFESTTTYYVECSKCGVQTMKCCSELMACALWNHRVSEKSAKSQRNE